LLADLGALQEDETAGAGAGLLRVTLAGGGGGGGAQPGNTGPAHSLQAVRLAAALAALDPTGSGVIQQATFVDWWNGMDAVRRAARARLGAAGMRASLSTTLRSVSRSRGGDTAGGRGEPGSPSRGRFSVTPRVGGALAVDSETALSSTVLYAVALRRCGEDGRWDVWRLVGLVAQPRFELPDPAPNAAYAVRVTATPRHATSGASKGARFMTPPLAPFAPVVVRTGPRFLSLRWYPGEAGAAKFEVQAKVVGSLLSIAAQSAAAATAAAGGGGGGGGAAGLVGGQVRGLALASAREAIFRGRNLTEVGARMLATQLPLAEEAAVAAGVSRRDGDEGGGESGDGGEVERWVEDVDGREWRTVYSGPYTTTTIAGLAANTVYRLRVRGLAAGGEASAASTETQAITLDASEYVPLTPASAGVCFVVSQPGSSLGHLFGARLPQRARHLPVSDAVVGDVLSFTEDVYVDGSAVRRHQTQTLELREVAAGVAGARHLCARTIAATVIGDTASAVARVAGAREDGAGGLVAAVARRQLTLQVEWCTIGGWPKDVHPAEAEAACRLPVGAIVKRAGAALAALDVYRALWDDEAGRWSFTEELGASFDLSGGDGAGGGDDGATAYYDDGGAFPGFVPAHPDALPPPPGAGTDGAADRGDD